MDKVKIKTFYTYNTKSNKQMLQAMSITITTSFMMILLAVVLFFTQSSMVFRILLPLVVIIPATAFLSSFVPAKKELEKIF